MTRVCSSPADFNPFWHIVVRKRPLRLHASMLDARYRPYSLDHSEWPAHLGPGERRGSGAIGRRSCRADCCLLPALPPVPTYEQTAARMAVGLGEDCRTRTFEALAVRPVALTRIQYPRSGASESKSRLQQRADIDRCLQRRPDCGRRMRERSRHQPSRRRIAEFRVACDGPAVLEPPITTPRAGFPSARLGETFCKASAISR